MPDTVWTKATTSLQWLPAYLWQRLTRRVPAGPLHLMLTIANHFEPENSPDAPRRFASEAERSRRVDEWCRAYPTMAEKWRDADGRPLQHTYFYPAEHYSTCLIDQLAAHCRSGWGEVEVHLHHGVDAPDTSKNTRAQLLKFRDALAGHGCLSRDRGQGPPRYAFVHGNWALANSGNGHACGVDDELQILADTGCYADFTLPSAPDASQIAKINHLYECRLPLDRRAAHRRGLALQSDRAPTAFPLIVQGPLALTLRRRGGRWGPAIENGDLTASNPPTLERLSVWRRAAIRVKGRPDWVFVKLHCHGLLPRDAGALVGDPMRKFLRDLNDAARDADWRVHFVTAREMTNIILAACDGREGDAGAYRDYRFRLGGNRQ
jgi:hypothetical protein